MKKIVCIALALMMVLGLCACSGGTTAMDLSAANNLKDLSGARIAAQSGTFHADAMSQIPEVKSSTLPEFADLLTALQSGTIDGYIAEEPTAIEVCLGDSSLVYINLVNNDTGFTATDADVGIAVGLNTGNPLKDQINTILAEISTETRMQLMDQMVHISAGETVAELALTSIAPIEPEGTLKVGM